MYTVVVYGLARCFSLRKGEGDETNEVFRQSFYYSIHQILPFRFTFCFIKTRQSNGCIDAHFQRSVTLSFRMISLMQHINDNTIH